MIIKVCGMCQPDNIRQVTKQAQVDWMGFIFYPRSPRCVDRRTLPPPLPLPAHIRSVGVFVNETLSGVTDTAKEYQLDYLQLHGSESPEFCRSLGKEGYKVIKVFSVGGEEDLRITAAYEGCADYFLFDTRCTGFGGSGQVFNWALLQTHYHGRTPFILSGGIGPKDAALVNAFAHPCLAGVDLNSRFETAPGIKDAQQLTTFCQLIQH